MITHSPDNPHICSYEYFPGKPCSHASGLLLLCDHASSFMPAHYNNLGISDAQMARHIAYDIGAREVTLGLAKALGIPAVLSTFSRLLIDPNRGWDDPTQVMRISDGALIPGNARIDHAEIERRRQLYYEPYHQRVAEELDAIERARSGKAASIVSVHSFTPVWRGNKRQWQVAVLWDCDARMPDPMIKSLAQVDGLTVGDNEPYDGALLNDCMFRHGTSKGRAHALIELRQDLIASPKGVDEWVGILSPILQEQMDNRALDEHQFYASRTGAVIVKS